MMQFATVSKIFCKGTTFCRHSQVNSQLMSLEQPLVRKTYVLTCFGLISPIIFGNAFVQRGKSMGEMLFIPPKSLPNHSLHLSHDSQTA